MTGRRFARIEERILTLEERLQAIESVKTQKQSSGYLKKAELFAYAALMPYYVPYAVSKTLAIIWPEEFKPEGKGPKIVTVLIYIFAVLLLKEEIKHYKVKTGNFLKRKKDKLKIKVKWIKDRKYAKVRINYRYAKNKIITLRNTSKEIVVRNYQNALTAPKKAARKIRRLLTRKKPSDPS